MLHLEAGGRDYEVSFDAQEIEDYDRGTGVDAVNTTIREALRDLM
jgi:hypothetical protein